MLGYEEMRDGREVGRTDATGIMVGKDELTRPAFFLWQGWSPDAQDWRRGNVRDQQAATEQADLALESDQVRPFPLSLRRIDLTLVVSAVDPSDTTTIRQLACGSTIGMGR